MFELAHVAGPVMRDQATQRPEREPAQPAAALAVRLIKKVPGEFRNVFAPLASTAAA
ncbi:hypothetical protein LP415_01965 [Polaromonas sp. P1(28)-8]|nr:hypothetical protein LP415_01965 [Polaromonas sp. P1(28)-8]